MSILVDLSDRDVAVIKQATKLDVDAAAIARAAKEFARLVGLKELSAASGKLDVDDNWREWEQIEIQDQWPS